MNRKQWYALAIAFWVLMILFISIDLKYNCDMFSVDDNVLSKYDVWCVVNGEIYDPFIWLFGVLWITFLICAWLQPKNNLDGVPKKHREVMKLALLEREVDNLKHRLKKDGKIKS